MSDSANPVDRLLSARLVGIVRLDDVELAVEAAGCAVEAGLAVVEVTFTLPRAAEAIVMRFARRVREFRRCAAP